MTNNQIIKALYARYGQDNWCHKPCVESHDYTVVVGTLRGPVHIEVAQTETNWWEVRMWSDDNGLDIGSLGTGATLEDAMDEAGDEFAAAVDEHAEQILNLKNAIGHL
jgi:hypothetical protein